VVNRPRPVAVNAAEVPLPACGATRISVPMAGKGFRASAGLRPDSGRGQMASWVLCSRPAAQCVVRDLISSSVLRAAARNGAGTVGDALRRAMHGGGSGTLVGRVEWGCGDGLSAAVVAFVALAVLGEWS
jgi:hypothetical protein